MRSGIVMFFLLALGTSPRSTAAAPPSRATQETAKPASLTNAQVAGMLKAGLSPEIVVAKIRASTCRFDTSPAALEHLKAEGVPQSVLLAMIRASAPAEKQSNSAAPAGQEETSRWIFQNYRNSIVTVWSEFGQGTGFIVDRKGLILTNEHVVGHSRYLAVQFDTRRKVPATVLAADPRRDIAVLRANLSVFPEAKLAPLATAENGDVTVVEGERVYTIGNSLGRRKVLTTGIVSRVELRAIISDINMNPGNSGGPLFDATGSVIGITTFREQGSSGAGISGIVRIEEAHLVLAEARARIADVPVPPSRLLPVEPRIPYPVEALREAADMKKVRPSDYAFKAGAFNVGFITPTLEYAAGRRGAERQQPRSRRPWKKTGSAEPAFHPLNDLRNWSDYAGGYRPVLLVRVSPRLRETFWSAVNRSLADRGYRQPANLRFRTSFYAMELYCNDRRVEPILPGKISEVIDVRNSAVNATDSTFEGFYAYPPEAISPACGKVTLEIFSKEDQAKPTTKVVSRKLVERVWRDFAPYWATVSRRAAKR
jgi:S1-C subfamily serine protease